MQADPLMSVALHFAAGGSLQECNQHASLGLLGSHFMRSRMSKWHGVKLSSLKTVTSDVAQQYTPAADSSHYHPHQPKVSCSDKPPMQPT